MSRKFLRIAALTAALALAFAGSAMAEVYKWTGGAGDNNWQTAGNWDKNLNYPGFAGGDSALFDVSATLVPAGAAYTAAVDVLTLSGDVTLTFQENANALTLKKVVAQGGKAVVDTTDKTRFIVSDGTDSPFEVKKGASLTIKGDGVQGIAGKLKLSGGGTLKLEKGLTLVNNLDITEDSTLHVAVDAALSAVNTTPLIVTAGNLVLDAKNPFNAAVVTLEMTSGDLTLNVTDALPNTVTKVVMTQGTLAFNAPNALGDTSAFDAINTTPVCVVELEEDAKMVVNKRTILAGLEKTGPEAGTVELNDELYIGGNGANNVEVPLTKVSLFAHTAACTTTVSAKLDDVTVLTGAQVLTLDPIAGAEMGTVYFQANVGNTLLGKLTASAVDVVIGTVKFDTVPAGLEINTANEVTVGTLEKVGGADLAAGDLILDLKGGVKLVLKEGKGTSKGVVKVTNGTLRVEKGAALLGADEVDVVAGTLSLPNGLTLPKLTTAANVKLLVDLVEANVGTTTPALTIGEEAITATLDLSDLALPKSLKSGDVVYVLTQTKMAPLDAADYTAPADMVAEVDAFQNLHLKATKDISVPKLTVTSNPVAKTGEEYVGVITISDVASSDLDWATLGLVDQTTGKNPGENSYVVDPAVAQSGELKITVRMVPNANFVSTDVKVSISTNAPVYTGSVVLKVARTATPDEPKELTASLTASKPTVKVGETVEFELGKWQYKGAEVEVQDVKWELDGVDKTADVVAGKLPAKAEKEGTMNLVVTAKLKSDPTVVGKATASVTVTKTGGGTGGSGGGGGCDAGFAGLALLLAAPLFLRKKD